MQILTEHQYSKEVVDRAETFIINPKYVEDTKLMARVGLTLGKIPGMPADFIQKQEARRTTVVSDDSLSEVFAKPTDKVAELLRIVGVIALKPTLANTDLSEVMGLIRDLVAEILNRIKQNGAKAPFSFIPGNVDWMEYAAFFFPAPGEAKIHNLSPSTKRGQMKLKRTARTALFSSPGPSLSPQPARGTA